MPRSPNAQIAAQAFLAMVDAEGYDKNSAWKAIAKLLLTCDLQVGTTWTPFKDIVVYRESNDFKKGKKVIERAEALTAYLASEFSLPRTELCGAIGQYWKLQATSSLQQHNLVGHAYRSLLVEALKRYGDSNLSYEEEVDPHAEFPGSQFVTRSENPKIDIVARRGVKTVALISSRWRYRHDRVDLIDEAIAYAGPARRANQTCQLYAWLGEFSPSRLDKVLKHCPPTPHTALSAAVHFNPKLLTDALKENGRTCELKSLSWLIDQTFKWQ